MSEELDEIITLNKDYPGVPHGLFKPHEYVMIKAEMSTGDDAWIQDHAMKSSGKGKQIELSLMVGQVKLATLHRMVKGWNLTKTVTDGQGGSKEVPLPYGQQYIEKLPRRVSNYVLDVIDKLNPQESEEEQKDFLTPAVVSSDGSYAAENIYLLKS